MTKRKTDNATDFQRQFDEIGLGTEEEREHHRGTGSGLQKQSEEHYTLRWFTDERDLELSKLKGE